MTDQENGQAKRRGRPRKAAVSGERKSISFRVTEDLYNYLVSVSERSGYSISEVVERHLEAQKAKVGRKSLEEVFIGRKESTELLSYYAMVLAIYDKQGDWRTSKPVMASVLAAMHTLNSIMMPLDTSKFGPRADGSDPQVAELNDAWIAGAQLASIIADPTKPMSDKW